MSYSSFKKEVIDKNGDFFTTQLEQFFIKAIDFAKKEKYDEALIIGNDALVFAKYSNAGYAVIYLIGMLCQAYIDNKQPEIANNFFQFGMDIITKNEDKNSNTYSEDIDSFLDLKIVIDREIKNKNGL